LGIQHQVSLRHSVHLRVIDVCCRGRRKPRVVNLGPTTETSCADLWTSSISSGQSIYFKRTYSSLNPYTGPYYLAAKTSQGLSIGTPIFQSSAGTASSSSSEASPDRDSTEDYPEIGGSSRWNPPEEGHRIIMVAPTGAPSQNSSSRYPTIGRLEASDAQTSNNRLVQNLSPDFNAVLLQTIMELIQRMAPEDSLLIALAQQGVEVTNHVIASECSVENHRGEPSGGNRSDGRAKRARSEASSLTSGNKRLADNDQCSGRSLGRTSLSRSTSTTAPATPKNSSKCIIQSLRPLKETIR
jgi:hypothetical protein